MLARHLKDSKLLRTSLPYQSFARPAMNSVTAETSQHVTPAPSLKGDGNRPALTHRQIVAGLTGSKPLRVLVVASSRILITLFDIKHSQFKQHMVAMGGLCLLTTFLHRDKLPAAFLQHAKLMSSNLKNEWPSMRGSHPPGGENGNGPNWHLCCCGLIWVND
jgi:hypothetical protein